MKLIVFAGLPGAGKSALAEMVACKLGIPIFAKDWLEATLLLCELVPTNQDKPLGSAGYQLLTVLAERQLMLGQSVILDSVASTISIRATWRELAGRYHAEWMVIECVCSDEKLHRARLAARQRNIPGWHELEWSEVERVKSYYSPWDEDRLIVDAIYPLEDNSKVVFDYLCEAGE
jgi:predicted kinase